MASRPVYVPKMSAPFLNSIPVEFTWNGGFAVSQKQKNIDAIHSGFLHRFPERKVLEISSKSRQELGVKLSAFNLKKYVPSLGKSIPLECIFQGGKVFAGGGPYIDLYTGTSREAKKDPRLKSSGMLKNFYFEGKMIPLVPKTAFYDWLYINALLENPELAQELLQYDSFTDVEFNPDKGVNCQAKAAAVYVALARLGLLEQVKEFDSYIALFK